MIFSEHKAGILDMTTDHVDDLHRLWSRMFEPQTCEDCLIRLRDHANSFYTDLLKESREKEQGISREIAELREVAAGLMRLLHKSLDMGERPDDMPLVVWQLKLDRIVEQLREELAGRRAEIGELLRQQEQLCQELGEHSQPLSTDPLPLPDELDAFRRHLQQLRDLRVLRLREMDQMRDSINHNMRILEIHAQSDAEKRLLNPECHDVRPHSYDLLHAMQLEYAEQVKEMRERIDEMRGQIDLLWQRLKLEDEYAMSRVRKATSYDQRTFDILREELERCQALRRQNLKTFIEQLRIEIHEWFDYTLKSPEERRLFTDRLCDSQSEEVLELLEKELDQLKELYTSNKKIFELYANRAMLWSRLEALEAKANDPNRFNNRGGQLLKEEKERKALACRLPKIDQQITELVTAYMSQANKPFLVNGEDILESMAADWEQHRQSKKQPSAQKKDVAVNTTSKMKPPLTPNTLKGNRGKHGSSSSLKKTPSKVNASTAAKSTGNLQKRRHPNDSRNNTQPAAAAKRNLIISLEGVNSEPVLGTLAAARSTNNLQKRRHPNLQPAAVANRNQTSSVECIEAEAVMGVNGQKQLKSPLKKVRVLEYSVRRGKAAGRPSIGSKSHPRNRPIPQLLVQPPSGEENEDDDEYADENEESGDF
ncbi:protein regulator of cytokinesis 1 [Drosophila biarmipes]|uniref:protein regulator of cytokinesis 1 n=1 Tax=Drosophila biarmipes TaxID=125945 RepID=UPI0007E5DBA0|nr:protein regulator of cytokinesis 1 [Drosophila biarmipes]